MSVTDDWTVHRPFLVGFVRKLTGNHAACEDIVQTTFEAAVRNAEGFEGRSDLRTWLAAIAKNEAFRVLGQRKQDLKRLHRLRQEENRRAASPGSDDPDVLEDVKNGCLFALLHGLPWAQRCAFVLRCLYDLPLADVARVVGRNENATRILVSRARSTVRSFLCDHCEHVANRPSCRCANLTGFAIQASLVRQIRHDPRIGPAKAVFRQFRDDLELLKSLPTESVKGIAPPLI